MRFRIGNFEFGKSRQAGKIGMVLFLLLFAAALITVVVVAI